ncbi:flippase [Haloferax volcanii]|uniref:Flippase n=1 Tax=Haloferax volcanii TaxID=2246 RepID=A0A558G9I3_HALVO|nr:flippase [Haloferax volcanii]TVT94421.1 flippase [Haloferax volcanii]
MGDSDNFLFSSGLLLFITQIFNMGVLFSLKIFLARDLDVEQFGVLSVGIATFSLLSTIILFGQNTGLGRYIPRFDNDKVIRDYIISAFISTVPVSIFICGLIAVNSDSFSELFLNGESRTAITIFACVIPLASIMKMTVGVIQGIKQPSLKALLQDLLLPLLLGTTVITAVLIDGSPLSVAVAYLLSYSILAFASILILFRYTPTFSRFSFKFEGIELLKFSAPLTITLIMFQILTHLDTFMIGYFSANSDVGIYTAIYPITNLLIFVLAAFRFIFMPVFSELHEQNNILKMKQTYASTTSWVILLTTPAFVTLILFPQQLITIIYGSEYSSGSVALTVLSVGFFTHILLGPNRNAVTAAGSTNFVSLVAVLTGFSNVILNILLIPSYSYVGAAVATAISYLTWNVCLNLYLFNSFGIVPFKKDIILQLVLSGVFGTLIFLISDKWAGIERIVVFTALFTIAYSIIFYFVGDRDKVNMIYDLVDSKF